MHYRRGFLAVLLVLALVLGTGWPMPAAAGMQGGAQASNMTAMAPDLSMSGMCDKCIEKHPATHACFAACVGVQAVLPVMGVLRVAARAPLDPLVERQFDGSAAPPDLPPPKLSVLV